MRFQNIERSRQLEAAGNNLATLPVRPVNALRLRLGWSFGSFTPTDAVWGTNKLADAASSVAACNTQEEVLELRSTNATGLPVSYRKFTRVLGLLYLDQNAFERPQSAIVDGIERVRLSDERELPIIRLVVTGQVGEPYITLPDLAHNFQCGNIELQVSTRE